jgi:hypothetical protein
MGGDRSKEYDHETLAVSEGLIDPIFWPAVRSGEISLVPLRLENRCTHAPFSIQFKSQTIDSFLPCHGN